MEPKWRHLSSSLKHKYGDVAQLVEHLGSLSQETRRSQVRGLPSPAFIVGMHC